MSTAGQPRPSYRFFDVTVAAVARRSPSFLRVTLTGEDLDEVADQGLDTRIKLVLPLPGARPGWARALRGGGLDWHTAWKALAVEDRPPLRTYTVAGVRPTVREVDVELVIHPGHAPGPAARWAASVQVGDVLAIAAPDARHDGPPAGLDFRPPAAWGDVLLVGDESAVPAIAGILAVLPATAGGAAVVEVADPEDASTLQGPAGVDVVVLVREGAEPGALLGPAALEAADRVAGPDAYAWIAGEAGVVTRLRRALVSERGWDRRQVTFSGYWRKGVAEGA